MQLVCRRLWLGRCQIVAHEQNGHNATVSEEVRTTSTAVLMMSWTHMLSALHASWNSPSLASSCLPLHLATCYDQRWPARGGCRPAGARETSLYRIVRLAWMSHLDGIIISGLASTHRCRDYRLSRTRTPKSPLSSVSGKVFDVVFEKMCGLALLAPSPTAPCCVVWGRSGALGCTVQSTSARVTR